MLRAFNLATMLQHVARHVGCTLWAQFENGQILHTTFVDVKLHDLVVVWPGLCNNVASGHAH